MPELKHTLCYRAIAGAVKNALDGHRDWKVPPAFAQSVAKRAAGTLMAHAAPEALAAARRSHGPSRALRREGGSGSRDAVRRAAPRAHTGRGHLHKATVALGRMAKDARLAGDVMSHQSLVEVLRLLAPVMGALKGETENGI